MKDLQASPQAPTLTLEKLLDYLEGKLTDAQAAEVDAVLANEPEWVDVLESLDQSLRSDPGTREKALAFREAATEAIWSQNTTSQAVAPAPSPRQATVKPLFGLPASVWRMAAVILVLVLPTGWFFMQQQQSLYEEMSGKYLKPYAITSLKGQGPTAAELLERGLATYQNGEYALAARILTDIIHASDLNEDERITANMYLGLSHLFSDRPADAVTQLSKVVQGPASTYSYDARWYLAWAHWKAGNDTAAREGFKAIAAIPGTHRAEAQKILDAWD